MSTAKKEYKRITTKTLVDMNRQLETLGYGKDNKMKVGVVSFYQPQCRVIRDEIRKINKDKLSFSAIDVEINTVIRYQGKEKPIILLLNTCDFKLPETSKLNVI